MTPVNEPAEEARVEALEQRIKAIEEVAAAALGLPIHGSREHLIEAGFRLTDDSRARARQLLAEAKERHACTDWAAMREQVGLPRQGGRPMVTDPLRLDRLQGRVARLEQAIPQVWDV